MKYLFIALVLAACGPAVQAQAERPRTEVVLVGTFSVAPFIVGQGNTADGYLVEFMDKEIAPRMGVRFVWQAPTSMARLEHNLVRGKVQFTPILAKTAARLRSGIVYAGDANIRFQPCIAVRADHPLDAIDSVAALAGMTIGWVQHGTIPRFLQDRRIKFELVALPEWAEANLNKLQAGRIDAAYFSDQFTPRYYSKRVGAEIKLLPIPALGSSVYAAFSPQAAPALSKRYEKAAREAFAQGKWEAFLGERLSTL